MMESKQPHGDEPKKKSLKLLLRSKPVAEVETSIGRIYLYPLRVRDMTDFEKLEPAEVKLPLEMGVLSFVQNVDKELRNGGKASTCGIHAGI